MTVVTVVVTNKRRTHSGLAQRLGTKHFENERNTFSGQKIKKTNIVIRAIFRDQLSKYVTGDGISKNHFFVEIKCQLDATEVFIAILIACSICFGHHYSRHQELRSIIQWLLPVVFRAVVFKLLVWCGAECYVSGLQDAAAFQALLESNQHPVRNSLISLDANRLRFVFPNFDPPEQIAAHRT